MTGQTIILSGRSQRQVVVVRALFGVVSEGLAAAAFADAVSALESSFSDGCREFTSHSSLHFTPFLSPYSEIKVMRSAICSLVSFEDRKPAGKGSPLRPFTKCV